MSKLDIMVPHRSSSEDKHLIEEDEEELFEEDY
jgi:hypothetical protein